MVADSKYSPERRTDLVVGQRASVTLRNMGGMVLAYFEWWHADQYWRTMVVWHQRARESRTLTVSGDSRHDADDLIAALLR